jgi:lysophospholipase L1-like esterase
MIPSQLAQFYMTNDVVHLNEVGYRKVAPIVEAGLRKAN